MKRLLLFILCSVLALGARAQEDSLVVGTAQLADRLIEEAVALKGTPYRYGATGPHRYDCSAFTRHVFRKVGIELPRSAILQSREGRAVEGPFTEMQKGDLLIFGARHNPKRIGHVGIFIETDSTGNDFSFVHIALNGGVQVNRYSETYYRTRFLGTRRILPDFLTPEPADTVAALPFDTEWTRIRVPDTLAFAAGDSLVVLLGGGRWAYVTRSGEVLPPSDRNKFVLEPDGSWRVIPMATHKIPSLRPSAAVRDASAPEEDGGEEPQPRYYVVKNGDSLSLIASRNHTTVKKLCALNGLRADSVLKVGRRLRVE